MSNVILHKCYSQLPTATATTIVSDDLQRYRQQRRAALNDYFAGLNLDPADQTGRWLARSFPVLSILAPVMSTREKTIEYPGDPMCLYAALSVAVEEAHRAYVSALSPDDPYNDLCPRWGPWPSSAYRLQVEDGGIRPNYALTHLNTDQTIYDPRVWNAENKHYFIEHVLQPMQPRVVLISTVSPGLRYAIDIAATVRACCPEALIVLGGRHVDETLRFNYLRQELDQLYSSPLAAMIEKRIPPLFDFLVSGDAYYAVDCLMKAISLAMDIPHKVAEPEQVVFELERIAPQYAHLPGNALVLALVQPAVHLFPMPGPKIDLATLPNPYQGFAIRARFPIFQHRDGRVMRTAHVLLTDACPYQCNFCSESIKVMGRVQRFVEQPIANALKRVLTCVEYGAESLFFDDSVFWGGNTRLMQTFCEALSQAQEEAQGKGGAYFQRLIHLQWGAQLTVEFLTSLLTSEKAETLLAAMKAAGCTYIYMGLESLASPVMADIHKNIQRRNGSTWSDKVWDGLRLLQKANIRAGTSVLFGLNGETKETIEQTIAGVELLIDAGLIYMASPNLLTYHPNTDIARLHGKYDTLDYFSSNLETRPPYTYFEEAFPEVVSITLREEDIWMIHHETKRRWGQKRLGVAEAIV